MPSLRSQLVARRLKDALWRQARCPYGRNFQVVHFSIQKDHLHLIVEATVGGDGTEAHGAARDMLRRGVSGLAISLARRLNRALDRRGKVWGDRHHRRDLASPSEVRGTLLYVLENHLRHGAIALGDGIVDVYSSALRFDGWAEPHLTIIETEPWPPSPPRTWLLATGWMRAGGKIETWAVPAGARRRSYQDEGTA
ncbi:MAG TPA: hypothetical protein VM925_33250 [Labilithrix sp.]|nr:hypothetical protein [Labilithrix sp.]